MRLFALMLPVLPMEMREIIVYPSSEKGAIAVTAVPTMIHTTLNL